MFQGAGPIHAATSTAIYFGLNFAGPSGGLRKIVGGPASNLSSWTSYAWPGSSSARNPPSGAGGVHGLTGRVEGATYALYLTTAGDGNALWRYDTAYDGAADSAPAYTLLQTAPAGTVYMSVVVAPVPLPPSTARSHGAALRGSTRAEEEEEEKV